MSDIDKLSDAQLSKLFLANDKIPIPNKRQVDLAPLLPTYAAMLKRRGVNKGMVFKQYQKAHPDGYKSSAFLERLN